MKLKPKSKQRRYKIVYIKNDELNGKGKIE